MDKGKDLMLDFKFKIYGEGLSIRYRLSVL